jgi:tetratricopeptide (TPR) repeat protein
VTARELLDAAAARIDGAFPDRPEVEAAVRATVGLSYRGLGLFEASERHLRKRYELVRDLVGDDHPRTIEAATDLAHVLAYVPRPAEAEGLARATLARSARVHGESDSRTIDLRVALAEALEQEGRFEEAEHLLLEGLELARARPERDPAVVGELLHMLGSILFKAGRLTEAEQYCREEVADSRKRDGDDAPGTITAIAALSGVLLHAGKFDEAEQLLDELVERSLRVRGQEHLWTTWARTTRADLYLARGERSRAEQEYRTIVEEVGSDDFAALTPLNGLAASLVMQQRFAEAVEPYGASLALARTAHGADHPDTLMIQVNLASAQRQLGELDEALELLEPAQKGLVRQLGEAHPNSLAASLELGRLLRDLELADEARVLFEGVLAKGTSSEGPRASMYVDAARQELGWLEKR